MSETRELKGIAFLESLPDGTLFGWLGKDWLISGDPSYDTARRLSPTSSTYGWIMLRGDGSHSINSLCNDQFTKAIIGEGIATASAETVTVLYPVPEEVCEWVLNSDPNEEWVKYHRGCTGIEVNVEGGKENSIYNHCSICGGKIKVKEKAKPAPKGLVEIVIVAGKTKYTGSMMYKFPGKEWKQIDHVIGRTATASDIEDWTVADKIENVLPPAPPGTVLFQPEPGDKWMEGDRPVCHQHGWADGNFYGWEGREILYCHTNHGFICRKPCTWTPLVLGWECECGYTFGHKPPRPDSCPKCKRPIKVAEPDKGLLYVEIRGDGKVCLDETDYPAVDLPFIGRWISKTYGLEFVGWATEDGGMVYSDQHMLVSKEDRQLHMATPYALEHGNIQAVSCTFAVFKPIVKEVPNNG
jgi:hypothetical protein